MVSFVANAFGRGCHRPPRHESPIIESDFAPTEGSNCRLLNGDVGNSPFYWQP